MKFVRYVGNDNRLARGKFYQVSRSILGGKYALKDVDGKFPKSDFEPVKSHEGTAIYMPKVGESFVCACYEKGQKVEYTTSPVVEIHEKGGRYIVHTKNSVYVIFVLIK